MRSARWAAGRGPVFAMGFLLLGGCLGAQTFGPDGPAPGPLRLPEGLDMGDFKLMERNETTGAWQWKAVMPPWVRANPGMPPVLSSRFQVPGGLPILLDVQYVDSSDGWLAAVLVDAKGASRCFGYPTARCYLPMREPLEADETWTLKIWPVESPPSGTPFQATVKMAILPPTPQEVVAYGASGPRPVPAALAGASFAVHPTGLAAFEPNIGATTSGTLFTTARLTFIEPRPKSPVGVLRSEDQGRSWKPFYSVDHDLVDADPWLWIDRDTNRIFRVAWNAPCTWLSVSDDEGKTWSQHPGAGCGLQAGHYEKLTTGPPPRGVTTQGYRNIVYYVSSLLIDPTNEDGPMGPRGVWATTSLDGGKTWRVGAEAHPWRPGCQGWAGPIAVAPDGTAFSAAMYCDGVRVAVSTDGGQSWRHDATLTDKGHMGGLMGPHLDTDREGRAYLFYAGRDGRAYLRSRDPQGGQWSSAVDVSPPGVKATTFHVIRVAAPGRLAMAFFGTDSDPSTWRSVNPLYAPSTAVWHMYVALSWDALGASPEFVSYKLSPDDDPIQRGCIDLQGSQTPSCRNLDDFMDLALHEGRPFVAYPDGCFACRDAASSGGSNLVVAALREGFDLAAAP